MQFVHEIGDDKTFTVRGIVTAKRHMGIESSFTIINVGGGALCVGALDVGLPSQAVEDSGFTLSYKYSSPLLRGVRLLEANRATNGRGRVRRAKLYRLVERPVGEYTVH